MDVEETPLPGIGIRKEITVATGRRVGVVIHRDGRSELIVSRLDDPDASLVSVPLTVEEAAGLGSLLGGAQLVAQLTAEHRDIPGVRTEQALIEPTSPFSGRTLGDTQLRTRTGASIVAILRSGEVLPSPTPDFGIRTGDVLVIVGTADGLAAAAEILHPR
ncbi:potassium/proton antiporter regulatory subunit (CPA2 family) [Glaciihabitans tibetensis]|uniref:Potassium/proton antiporter regulatory subunit (CPA2 family) n=1 Tax=Glaciihabitans tibetensis TaxID=1266600 RepID=A0A2T0V6V1_9MICO|nr:cation:proton antiporter regulatory subunit [Glaciihabitans tibetensis]PRY65922.1 potassium/proton antiporter regulatory subunit (CPA2 family) [Glaciihabitans tibetensis]